MRHLCGDWRVSDIRDGLMIVLCMSAAERTEWAAMLKRIRRDVRPVRLPCVDCLPEFAAEMAALYRCNGYPGMASVPKTSSVGVRGHPQPLAIRAERRRASWRAYRARARAKARATA